MEKIWLHLYDGLEFEMRQAKEEGRLISDSLKTETETVLAMPNDEEKAARATAIFRAVQNLPYADGNCKEPDTLTEIQTLAPGNAALPKPDMHTLYEHIYGAWLGRCAGCLLGKPVEGWRTPELHEVLKATENFPITHYITKQIPEATRQTLPERIASRDALDRRAFIENVDCMPEDDDTNYTVIGLKLLETCGADFTPEDVADCWLNNLPIYHVCTAERIAYRNLVMCIDPPASARYCNGYREWIGAQIRADMFGYVHPGKPAEAASMAWRDACISHVKNGIYGEMWVAAMLSAACVETDIEKIIRIGLNELPQESRLVKSVSEVMEWHREGLTGEDALKRIHTRWDEFNAHDWCHTISNAMIVTAALLFGEGDFTKSMHIAVSAGFDTDCNGATVGSILGMRCGASKLPKSWIEPLHDTLESGVDGFGRVKISDLAKRTTALVK